MNQAAFAFEPHDPVPAALARLRVQVEAEYGGRSFLFEKFLAFHAANPHVLRLLLRFADELRPGRHYGIGALFERVRWELAISTTTTDGLRLNNNHRAYFARLLILLRPGLGAVFATRRLGPGREGQIV
jgi:hypothetical protein